MGSCLSKSPDLSEVTRQIEARYRLNTAIIFAIYDWFSKCIDKANRTRTPIQLKIQQSISQTNTLSVNELKDALGMPQSVISEHLIECAMNERTDTADITNASLSYPEFLELMVIMSLCTIEELIAFGYHAFDVNRPTRHLALNEFVNGLNDISAMYNMNLPITSLTLTMKTIADQSNTKASHVNASNDSPQASSRMRSLSRSSSTGDSDSQLNDLELTQSIFTKVMINQAWFITLLKSLQLVIHKKTGGSKFWKKQRIKLMNVEPLINQTISEFVSRKKPMIVTKQLTTHRSNRHQRIASTLHSRAMSRIYQNIKSQAETPSSLATIPLDDLNQLRDAARVNQGDDELISAVSSPFDQPRSIMKKGGSSPLTRTKTHMRAASHSINPSINPSVSRSSIRRNSVAPIDSINEAADPESPLQRLDARRDSVTQSANRSFNQAYSDVDSPVMRPRGKVSRRPHHFGDRNHSTSLADSDRERIAPPLRLKARVSSMSKSTGPVAHSSDSIIHTADPSTQPSIDQVEEEGEDEVEQSRTGSFFPERTMQSQIKLSFTPSVNHSNLSFTHSNNVSFSHTNNTSLKQLACQDSESFSPASNQVGWMMRSADRTEPIDVSVVSSSPLKPAPRVRRASAASPSIRPYEQAVPRESPSAPARHIRSKTIHQTGNPSTKPPCNAPSSISSPSSHRPSVVRLTQTLKPRCNDSPTSMKAIGQSTLIPTHQQAGSQSPDHLHHLSINTTIGANTNHSNKQHSPSSHRHVWHPSSDTSNLPSAQSSSQLLGFHISDTNVTTNIGKKSLSPPLSYSIPPGHPLYTSPNDYVLGQAKQSPHQYSPARPRINPRTSESPHRLSGRIITVAE